MTLIAEYVGWCEDCGDRITPGQEITRVNGEYLHVRCPDDLETTAPICGECHMMKPCECEDD